MNERFQDPAKLRATVPAPAEQDIVLDFGQLLRILQRNWWIIGGSALAAGLLAAIFVLQVEPRFASTGQLLLGQQNRADNTLRNLVQELNLDDDAIAAEIAIINSGRILSQVAERLELSTWPEFNAELRPVEESSNPIAAVFDGGVDLLRSLLGAGTAPPAAAIDPDGPLNPVDAAALAEKSRLGEQADFVGTLAGGLRVRQQGGTRLVNVSFNSTNRRIAAAVPNAVMDVYIEDQLERKYGATRRVTSGLNDRLNDLRARLETSERAVIEFRNQMLSEGFGAQERLDQQLNDLSSQASAAGVAYAELVSRLTEINTLIRSEGMAAAAGLLSSDLIDTRRAQIAELRQRRELLMERFGEDNPRIADLDADISRLEIGIAEEVNRLREDLSNQVSVAGAREQTLLAQLRSLEQQALRQSERLITLAQLEREQNANRLVYENFLNQFTQTTEVVGLQEADAQIIKYATVPTSARSPNKRLTVALGLAAGTFIGLGIVFLRALLDQSVGSVQQYRRLLGGVHVEPMPRVRWISRWQSPMDLVRNRPQSPLAEAVRAVRSFLLRSPGKTKGQVIAFMSVSAGSGTTTTALLLAQSVVQMGKRCIVIDTDLRDGSVAESFGVPARPDIVDLLRSEEAFDVAFKDALRRDDASKVDFLTARSNFQDPASVFAAPEMGKLISRLAALYDVVILDAAPMQPVADAIPVAKRADQVVMVAQQGRSATARIETAVQSMQEFGVTVTLGVLAQSAGAGAAE